MTSKPMTPREDVEFWLTQSMRFIREDGNVPVNVQDKLINLLRTILAERDEAYRRGQIEMQEKCRYTCITNMWTDAARAIADFSIKETPDV